MRKREEERERERDRKRKKSRSLLVGLNLQSRIINRSMKNGPPRATVVVLPRFIVINFIIDSSSEGRASGSLNEHV